MGVMVSPNIAQEVMEHLLKGIDDVDVYIDNIGVFSLDWTSHISVIDRVLTILQDSGFTVNPTKCEWAIQEINFLGYWLTPHGIAPYKRKVQALLQMQPPKNIKQLRSFLGLVNFYDDMWPQWSHVLAPLTDLTGSKSFIWTSTHHEAFNAMKAMVAKDAMLAYPDHNKPFTIETDASDYQLGAVIEQDGRPVSYYSQKLTPTQKNYTTIEKELLSIVETLREFRSMLLGAPIHIYTDDRNLTHKMTQFTTECIMLWRLLIEEFSATYHYKQGSSNCIANAISRLPTSATTTLRNSNPSLIPHSNSFLSPTFQDPNLFDCFLQYPLLLQGKLPFHMKTIFDYQQQDAARLATVVNDSQ